MTGSTATYHVTGMTCQHCVSAVQEEVGALAGVVRVDVQLVERGTSTVTVDSATPLDTQAVRDAVEEAGYDLLTP
jgi:copper chaperone